MPVSPSSPAARVRHLLALDARNVMKQLAARQLEMVSLFSRRRDREPLTTTVKSLFEGISFSELVLLEPSEQRVVNHFHELLGELRWYLRYTEDMPLQLQQRLDVFARQLGERHDLLTAVLGSADAKPVAANAVRPASARRLRKQKRNSRR